MWNACASSTSYLYIGGCAEKIHLVPGVATQQFASQAGPSSEERHSQIDSPPVFVDTIGTSNTTGRPCEIMLEIFAIILFLYSQILNEKNLDTLKNSAEVEAS